ncbi:hypothetical protein DERF_009798 [Dermatophagoides farinae]|uniref:Uncharacterized protein n=1 Tax=Dermatophagoides farinae TaxID=6954 RepID=A0A922L645_DERFA|nr:hypothetical protein DERF_009798 [Dermatophagoides farinae]
MIKYLRLASSGLCFLMKHNCLSRSIEQNNNNTVFRKGKNIANMSSPKIEQIQFDCVISIKN